jgi:hypothetical protein
MICDELAEQEEIESSRAEMDDTHLAAKIMAILDSARRRKEALAQAAAEAEAQRADG